MNITISGHQIDSSDSLDAKIHSKANKVAEHFQDLIAINVILSKVRESFQVEVNTNYAGKPFSVTVKDIDMYHAVSEAFKKLDMRLKSSKSIRLSHRNYIPDINAEELCA